MMSLSALLLLAAALLFSTGGLVIKSIQMTSWQVSSFRSAIAAVALMVLLPEARRGWSLRVLLLGVAYAATLVLFVAATKLTTAANAIFLQSTAPLYLLLLGPWLLREPLRRCDFAALVAVGAGLLLLLSSEPASTGLAPSPAQGNWLAAASGVTWALTLAGVRWLNQHKMAASPLTMVAMGNVLAFVVSLPFALPVLHWRGQDLLLLGYLGLFQIGLAYWCLTRGMRQVPALMASLLLLTEPVLNPVWTWLLLGEKVPGLALAGGAFVLAAALLQVFRPADVPGASSAHRE